MLPRMFSSLSKNARNGLSVEICPVAMVSVVSDAALAPGVPPMNVALTINATVGTICGPFMERLPNICTQYAGGECTALCRDAAAAGRVEADQRRTDHDE